MVLQKTILLSFCLGFSCFIRLDTGWACIPGICSKSGCYNRKFNTGNYFHLGVHIYPYHFILVWCYRYNEKYKYLGGTVFTVPNIKELIEFGGVWSIVVFAVQSQFCCLLHAKVVFISNWSFEDGKICDSCGDKVSAKKRVVTKNFTKMCSVY